MGVEIIKSRAESNLRWAILVFSCLMMIGNYYCYDIPAALNSQLDDYMGQPGDYETMFSLLYTVYSVPNVILPFFGGYFVDKWGVRICLIIFTICITIGQLIFAIGVGMKSWPVMFLGRIVFGLGGENLGVANSAILSVWFKGKEVAFAFGLSLSIARLGSVFNNLTSPVLADQVNIQFALWFGVILCGTSIACVVCIFFIDKRMDAILSEKGHHSMLLDNDDDVSGSANDDKLLKSAMGSNDDQHHVNASERVKSGSFSEGRTLSVEGGKQQVTFQDALKFQQIFWLLALICVVVYGCVLPFNNIASALLLERDYFIANPSDCTLKYTNQCEDPVTNPPSPSCPTSKWYQPPIPTYNISYSDIDCTDDYYSKEYCGSVEYCDRQSTAETQSTTVMSIPYIISACLSPFLGGFVDRFGKRAVIATLSPAVLVVVHSSLGYTTCDPVGPLVGQGLAYSGFAAVVWPSVAMVVEERLVGLAYGIVVSIQNLGLATFPLMIAAIYQNANDQYIPQVETFFVILAWAGFVIGLYLNYYDYYYLNSLLNRGRYSKKGNRDPKAKDDSFTLVNPVLFEDDQVRHISPASEDDEMNKRQASSEIYADVR